MTPSNDISTMTCGTGVDRSHQWAVIMQAFESAAAAIYSAHSDHGSGAKSWGEAEQALSDAALALATFFSDDPRIVRKKRDMAASLREWSVELDQKWAEGLANLIDASNREMPAHISVDGTDSLPTPRSNPTWPPARDFWESVRRADDSLGIAALSVLKAAARTEQELCAKVLIAAFTGALALVVRTTSVGPIVDPAAITARLWMQRLMTVGDLHCLAAIMDPRSFEDIMDAARADPFDSEFSSSELVRVLLGLAHDRWHREIWADAKRLRVGGIGSARKHAGAGRPNAAGTIGRNSSGH